MGKFFALLAVALVALVATPGVGHAAPADPSSAALYEVIRNKASGKCLDLENDGNGRYVQQWPCHFRDNQKWQMVADPGDPYHKYEVKPRQWIDNGRNECLDVEHNGAGPYTQRYSCRLSYNQIWQMYRYTDGTFELRPWSNQYQCLDASDWGKGLRVQVYNCHGGPNQRWSFG